MKAEQVARAAHRGIWADPAFADLPADKPDAIPYGAFTFVTGKVIKAERVKNIFYLNFGEDWHEDLTVAIAAHDLHLFKKAGFDLGALQGKNIRVRGWIKRDFGPMMMVTDPDQIEVLGEPPKGT